MNELQYFNRADEAHVQGFRTIQVGEGIHPYMAAWWPAGHIIGYEHTFIHGVADLLKAVAEGKKVKPDFRDGLACQKVMAAGSKSAVSKKWVKV